MHRIGNRKSVEVIQGQEIIHPSPRLRLNSVRDCRRELVKVYLQTRRGEIDTQTATRLAFLLQTLVAMIRDGEMEARIEALEREIEVKRW